ncbi:SurA N-terminal domain-containing protein [Alkalimonas sp. MEB108]|uniref:Periplasmic chaperone PpiD n=1 Tax=Alkalimonas cellulosilytica TaxID=3058395 RepID=A0ABU7J532_9GAMM|nr:SurA N-terminal domain-containing protein [Alkalimonas sp. MEB108]MEE2001604.1 SurA N-terminal domain-containing protein [Alkalimonas sp. MEB108]
MLEKIREGSQGLTAKIILGLVILTFALAGVGGYLGSTKETPAAEVNGEGVTRAALEQAYQNERARMEQQFGDMFEMLASDPAYMAGFRADVLERLIDETLQKQYARQLGLRVSDDAVRDLIRSMPEFQVGGVFNNDRYLALLRQAGLQTGEFRDMLRDQMVRQQLVRGLILSEFATPAELQRLMALQQQSRDIQYIKFQAEHFVDQVELTDAMLEQYYYDNLARYETEEKVAVEYIELSIEQIAKDISVTEAEARAFYNANLPLYSTDERRQVAHILFESMGSNADIKAKAEQVLAELQAGADFAEVAARVSDDTFSAAEGGVLPWLNRGDMEPSFEDAAFALTEAGELSAVVQTSFGYHILQLHRFEPSEVRDFAEVQAEIIQALQQERAYDRFFEIQQLLADVSFDVPDNLQEAADVTQLPLRRQALFSRQQAAAPLNHPQVLQRLFNLRFIGEGLNSEPIEVGAQHLVVARVTEHQPARTQSLDEVREQVVASLRRQQSSELARQQAAQVLAQFQQDGDFAAAAAAVGIEPQLASNTARFGGSLDTEIRAKAFALPRPNEARPVSADLAELMNGDMALVAVTAVRDSEVTEVPDAEDLERFANQHAQQAYEAMLAALKSEAKIKRPRLDMPEERF